MPAKTTGFAFVCAILLATALGNLMRRPAQAAAAPAASPATQPVEVVGGGGIGGSGGVYPLPYRNDIEVFLNRLGEGKINDANSAFELIFKQHPELRERFQRQFSSMYGAAGKYHGSEVVSVIRLTHDFQRVDVLAYFDSMYVMFKFTYWHNITEPADQWKVVGINVITDSEDMFKDHPPMPYHEQLHLAEHADATGK